MHNFRIKKIIIICFFFCKRRKKSNLYGAAFGPYPGKETDILAVLAAVYNDSRPWQAAKETQRGARRAVYVNRLCE